MLRTHSVILRIKVTVSNHVLEIEPHFRQVRICCDGRFVFDLTRWGRGKGGIGKGVGERGEGWEEVRGKDGSGASV